MPVCMSAVLCVCACVCAVYKEAWRTESIKRVCCVIIASVRALPNRSTDKALKCIYKLLICC